MKKITFMLIALLCAVVTFAAGPKKQFSPLPFTPEKASVQMGKQLNAKPAPAGLAKKVFKAQSAKARAPKKALAAADLAGDYQWDYEQASNSLNDATPETMTTTAGSVHVVISAEGSSTTVNNGWVASEQGYGNASEVTDITIDKYTTGIFAAGSNTTNSPKYYDTGTAVRMYVGNTLTITSEKKIATIELTFVSANYSYLKVGEDDIALADNVGTWTGEATEVVFTVPTKEDAGTTSNPQARIQEIKVTYAAGEVEEEEEEETEEVLTISGMFDYDLTASIETDESYGDYILIESQLAGTSSYGNYVIKGLLYYEGDEEVEAGYYFMDENYGWPLEDGTIIFSYGFVRILTGGQYDGYYLTPYWLEESTLTPAEPLTVVTPPAGVLIDEYTMYYDNSDGSSSAKIVNVAVDGNDVYFQSFSDYIPESWVKGTKDGNTVTFPEMQYMGVYEGYETYAFYAGPAVFTYDAEADTYTAEGEIFGVLGNRWFDGRYFNPVIKKVVEKAVMPANPEITALANGNYGWYFNFNVPTVDVNGEDLVIGKLAYKIYTDIEGEIAPLTFTPTTHSRLTGEMTEIPYGFTENYDFYTDQIYLNELYSADWNNLGIQSIYYGGGETNATEVQWFHIKDYSVSEEPTWVAANQGYENAQEIATITIDEFTTGTLAQDEGKNAPKYYTAGTALRMYAGNTLTINSEKVITKLVFAFDTSKTPAFEVSVGEFDNDTYTWTGEASEIKFTVPNETGQQTRIQSIDVTYAEEVTDPDGLTYNFDDSTMEGWTTIDADGDGYTWVLGSEVGGIYLVEGADLAGSGHNASADFVVSGSYSNVSGVGALSPDNFLVSPKIKLGAPMKFYAAAQDASYPAEHFGVYVSTNGNTSAADFKAVSSEWEMTASRVDNQPSRADNQFRGPKKAQGKWYEYTVDLSEYEGQVGYVAIRHFNCTDNFILDIDDITFGTPEYVIVPAEGVVESLSDFEITFNKYDVVAEGATATLTNTTTEASQSTTITARENTLIISFEETTEPGDYTLTLNGVAKATGEPVELTFNYTIEAAPEVVVLPEGLEAETWYLNAKGASSSIKNREVAVAVDGSDIYLQGLCEYLPEAWVKGTIDGESATFPTGQYYGLFADEYDLFFVGYLGEVDDVVFEYDAEAGTLTTDAYIVLSPDAEMSDFYDYYSSVAITREPAELEEAITELPEGVEPEVWYLSALDSYGDLDQEVQVAIDGTDMYIQGLDFGYIEEEEVWVKGTIADGKVTFPSGQYFGEYYDWWYETTDDLYFMGWDGMTGALTDEVVFDYDAEAGRLIADPDMYFLVNVGTTDVEPYYYCSMVEITKDEPVFPEAVEVPEGLEVSEYAFEANELKSVQDQDTGEISYEEEDVSFPLLVGFDGNDVYFKGFTGSTADEAWAKATRNPDGTYTIPANQFLGVVEGYWSNDPYYLTSADEEGNLQDIVLNYDAEAGKFTTDQYVYLNASRKTLYYYNEWFNVVITAKQDVAATPADPEIDELALTGMFPKAYFNIPAEDVDGNPLLTSKLFYTVWFEEDGNVQPYVVTAEDNKYVDEDMVEVPYSYNDSYDIFEGGATFYFNPTDICANWTNVGIQSIYYGGGECNKSNIVWSDETVTTGIAEVKNETAKMDVIFDLQGRRVAKTAKGLYIMSGKKVVVK